MNALRLLLVRHAETALNAERRYQGLVDPPLSPAGVARAERLRTTLASLGEGGASFRSVHSSDRRRALQTAAVAMPGVRVTADPRLRELDFGAFDGRTWEENLAAHGDLFRAWVNDPAGVRPPSGETLDDLERRVEEWLHELPLDVDIVVFTHAGVIHVILARALGISFHQARGEAMAPGDTLSLIFHLDYRDRAAAWTRLPTHPRSHP